MRSLCFALVFAVLVGACGDGRPTVASWTSETWTPLVESVPAPRESDPARCDHALADLRANSESLKPAPDGDIGQAADKWLRRAETLVFDCASSLEGFDYEAEYAELERLRIEVESLVATAGN